jgi:FixJ family two-component response regulator
MSEATAPIIAIVDDEESVRVAMDSLIRSAGYRRLAFEPGVAFLESTQKYEIRCLILDIDMPGLNGLDVRRRLAEMRCAIPTIFVTGRDGEFLERAPKQGAFAVLAKMSSGEALLKVIESALQSDH